MLAPLSITPGSSILAHMPGAMVAVNSVGGGFFFVGVEKGRDEGLFSFRHERSLTDSPALVTSATSESGSSSFPPGAPFLVQSDVLRLCGVHPANLMIRVVLLTGFGDLPRVC